MGAIGSFQEWTVNEPDPNMMLVADYTWQGEFYITNSWNDFKFIANENWNTSWREVNQSVFVPPITGRVDQMSSAPGANIIISNTPPGLYQFTFYEKTSNYSIRLVYTNGAKINIIEGNASFERNSGGDDTKAKYWRWGDPDMHGDTWGNAERRDWEWERSHSGFCKAAIHGNWIGSDYGGWWREGPATNGVTYQASAWFWADNRSDNVFTAGVIELKVEFMDAQTNLIDYASTNFNDITERWTKKTVRMTAPEDTVWARLTFAASQTGPQGALQVDDVELIAVLNEREQDFNRWNFQITDNTYTYEDWILCTGKTVSVDARSGYAASLPYAVGRTNYVQTPELEDGLGTISFWYRNAHSDTNSGATNAVGFRVLKTANLTSTWSEVASVTNILNTSYKLFSYFVYDETSTYYRIEHIGPTTNRLLIDDIQIEMPSLVTRQMDFNMWPEYATNLGTYTFLDWEVTTGSVSAINAYEGNSALLPGCAAFSNYVRSPYLSDGYGTLSFVYCRGTNGTGTAGFQIESSADNTNWTVVAALSNIEDTAYQSYSKFFYTTNASFLRIVCVTNRSTLDATTLIDESFNGGTTPPLGWVFNGITDIYDSDASSGRAIPALRFDNSNDWVQTCALANPTNFSFWLKGMSTSTSNNHFIVERAIAGAWTIVTNISPLPTSEATYSFVLPTTVTNLRFTYYKTYGNAAFDDVIVQGLPSGSLIPPQDLLIDNIDIQHPSLSRSQNFNVWPAESSYGEYEDQGWTVYDGVIDSERAYSGQIAKLDSSPASNQYIQTPYLPEGIGPVSFKYSRWDETAPLNVYYRIELSSNGTTWVSNDTIHVTSTTYYTFNKFIYDPTSHYVRIIHVSGGDKVMFDDIVIGSPSPPPNVVLNAWHDPSTPYTNDAVFIWANVSLQLGATVAGITTYYRIGTSGVFSPVGMQISNRVNYVTTNAIPPQNSGTTVQYYVECHFGGTGSELTSPRYYPEGGPTNPAQYRIPRNQSGRVWINELNYLNDLYWDTDTNEFIEICGPAGWDLSGWTIDLFIANGVDMFTYYASYTIPDGTILADDASGYGFFVLGDLQQTFSDMYLTNIIDEIDPYNQITDGTQPSGIRLSNEGGGIEQNLCYGGVITGFTPLAAEEDYYLYPDPYALQLSGAGYGYTNFTWSTNGMTPGSVNTDQILTNAPSAEPDILVLGTNGAAITNGDVTPITSDGTDFGSNTVSSGYTDHTFTITNSGAATLHVSGVSTSGAQAADFLLISVPATSVDAGQTTTFIIRFTPGTLGARNATLHVTSDDADEGDYTFAVTGNGYELESPPADVEFSRMQRQTNVLILTLHGNTNNWDVAPFWTTNLGRGLLFTQTWQAVETYTNSFDAGTTTTIIRFNLPTGNVYMYRVLVTRP